jgi:hypothetical protein
MKIQYLVLAIILFAVEANADSSTMDTGIRRALCALVMLFAFYSPAQAVMIDEVSPDAGELVSTAQDTTGTGAVLESISGTLIDLGAAAPVDDVDLYKILITDPAAFSVMVAASLSGNNDAMLHLFDSAGVQVLVDDDGSGTLLPQFNPGDLSGPAGEYFLAFNLFLTNPEDVVSNPPTLDDGWFRDPIPFQTGPYTLNLTGVSTAVPVPAAVWLFGSGLLGLVGMARRKKV